MNRLINLKARRNAKKKTATIKPERRVERTTSGWAREERSTPMDVTMRYRGMGRKINWRGDGEATKPLTEIKIAKMVQRKRKALLIRV